MKPALKTAAPHIQAALWVQVRGWALALASVASLIDILITHQGVQRGLLIVLALVTVVAPLALMVLVVMIVLVMAALYWARSPRRSMLLRTGSAMCCCLIALELGILSLKHVTGPFLTVGLILFMGIGGTLLMFMEIVIPKWEARGFLRHPKITPDLGQPVER